jgi:Protein of unknown function (DUF3995)
MSFATTRWAYLASAWCAVFAVLHVFWALGGDIGLAESAGIELASRRPMMFVLVGLWGVAALLVVGAAFARALARHHPRGRLRRPAILTGLLVGTALLVRGVGIELVLLLDAGGIASSVGPVQTRWSLLLWNPWFMLGGVAFLFATYRFARLQPEGPR